MDSALLILCVAALLAPLGLALLGHRDAAGALVVFMLLTRFTDIGLSLHGVGDIDPTGLSDVSQGCLIGLAVLALARRTRQHPARSSPAGERPWLAMATYLAVLLASSIWATSGSLASGQALSLFKNLTIVFVLVELLDSARALRLALWAAVAAGATMAGLTVAQAATHSSSNSVFGFAQAPVRQLVGIDQSFRSAGPIGDPNFYALVLAVLVPIALMRLRDETRPSLRIAAGATVLLLIAGIVLTYSRGGLVTLAVSLALFALLARVRVAQLVLAAVIVVPLLPFVPGAYWERIGTLRQGDNSISQREQSQEVALQMFVDHPVLGVGANNYPVAYLPYALRLNEPAAADEPHNLYLAVAAETGLLGLITFLAAQGLVLRYAWQRRATALARGDPLAEGLATTVLLALLTYLAGVAFLPIAYPRYLWILVGLALAAPIRALARSEPHVSRPVLALSGAP